MTAAAADRCRIVPLPGHQISFQIDRRERLRWHSRPDYPRPFFYPLCDPAGNALTRMGHPGTASHDHHLSIWFAHQNVAGHNFWEDGHGATIRQRQWLCYQDSNDAAIAAVMLDWYPENAGKPLVEQEQITAVSSTANQETLVEVQATFMPTAAAVEFGKTNFGFVGVRVAKSISAYFGDGKLHDSEGRVGESEIFGQPARWVDYSGTVVAGPSPRRAGITYFDHAQNPGFPNHWHVRSDGWMIASPCMRGPLVARRGQPLVFRFLLHAHGGMLRPEVADKIAAQFASRPAFQLARSSSPHVQYQVRRAQD